MYKKTKIKFLLPIFLILLLPVPSFSQEFDLNGTVEVSRPPSAFSLCCCKKERGNSQEVIYECKHFETDVCPDDWGKYNVSPLQCPSILMNTKYKH